MESLRELLANDPSLVHAVKDDRYGGTGLHLAAHRGHTEAVRLLLERGADPNARDIGDNAYPLHFAAGAGHLEIVRALLDAGGDVHGFGDVHEGDVIGWAAGGGPRRLFGSCSNAGRVTTSFRQSTVGDLAPNPPRSGARPRRSTGVCPVSRVANARAIRTKQETATTSWTFG